MKGKLKRWVAETVGGWCRTKVKGKDMTARIVNEEGDSDEGEDDSDRDEDDNAQPTFGSMRMVDGEFVIETTDFEETICNYMEMLDARHDNEIGTDESTEDEDAREDDN